MAAIARVSWLLFVLCFAGVSPAAGQTALDRGFAYLKAVMDQYHDRFYVYSDVDAGGNHYYPSLWYNGASNMRYDGNWRVNPKAGSSCIRVEWTGGPGDVDGYLWNGIMFQDAPTWDTGPGPGFDLRGASRLRGWVRTDNPGLRLKLLVGFGSDSCGEVAMWSKPLTRDWQPFEIDLRGKNLSRVSGGFAFVFNDVYTPNPSKGCVFYLDEIEFDLARPNAPRLLRSFDPHPTRDEPAVRNTAFVYDNALAIHAFLARGQADDVRRARLIADALIDCQENDRTFRGAQRDFRLRNAYMAGDIPLHPGEPPRLPGFWGAELGMWLEDHFQVSTHAGNLAWAMLAFLEVHKHTGEANYLLAAERLAEWVQVNCFNTQGPGGYTGGLEGWEATAAHPQGQRKPTWKSTEHNLDLIVAFARLFQVTKRQVYLTASAHAKRFVVEAMYHAPEGRFVTGTQEGSNNLNLTPRPLDVNSWALLVLGPNAQTQQGLDWAETHCLVEGPAGDGFTGFDFNDDRDGIWLEGTGQMVVAYQVLRENLKATRFLQEMRRAQLSAPGGNGLGLVAASHDGVTTGFDLTVVGRNGTERLIPWVYNRQLHVGATAWFLFAELSHNPYWGQPATAPIPS